MSIDREWQNNSIKKTLEFSLEMLHVSLASPKIVKSPRRRALQTFKDSKYQYFLDLFETYIKEKTIHPNKASSKAYCHLLNTIDFLCEDYFTNWLDNLEPLEKSIVDSFQLLQIVTEKRLKKSAIANLNNEKRVHELYQENEKIKSSIKALQNALKRKILCSKWKKAAKEVLIQSCEKDLTYCKYENNLRIKREIVLSSSSIRQIQVSSVTKQNELKEELQRIKKMYENLLKENLRHEKSARNERSKNEPFKSTDELISTNEISSAYRQLKMTANILKRNKLHFQLNSILKKFDQTIGDNIKERMDLMDEYEKQKESFDSFLIAYYQQEAEYEGIVRAKKNEERHHHEQKLLVFMMNRSARVIQKHWRTFRRAQKKAAKKNKGRSKSKKK